MSANVEVGEEKPESRVFNMDCMEGMKQYPDKYFDLAIVDPPYGIGVSHMAYIHEQGTVLQKNGDRLRTKPKKYKGGDWDSEAPWEEYFSELFRISEHQIIWGSNYQQATNIPAGGAIIWDKCTPGGLSFSDAEIAFCSLHKGVKLFRYLWSGFAQAKSIVEYSVQRGDKSTNEERIHPTQKPIDLYKWLLKNYAKSGDKILDTHLGSGSSRIAAYDMGFDFTGYEIDKDYFTAQEERFQKHIRQTSLFPASEMYVKK
jgi:site-specific DNA-methyltransferase (adenine-specific)